MVRGLCVWVDGNCNLRRFEGGQLDVWMWQADTSWIWDAQLDNYRPGQVFLISRSKMMIPEVFKSSEANRCRWSDAEAPTVSPDLTGLRRVEQLTVSDDMFTWRLLTKIAFLGGQWDICTAPNVMLGDNSTSLLAKGWDLQLMCSRRPPMIGWGSGQKQWWV